MSTIGVDCQFPNVFDTIVCKALKAKEPPPHVDISGMHNAVEAMLWLSIALAVVLGFLLAKKIGLWPTERFGSRPFSHFSVPVRHKNTSLQNGDEPIFREALEQIRNRASEWAGRDPWSWSEVQSIVINEEAAKLPIDRQARFFQWAHGLPKREIFTDEALATIATAEKRPKWVRGVTPRPHS